MREGFRVTAAQDGQEGYDYAIDLSIDLSNTRSYAT